MEENACGICLNPYDISLRCPRVLVCGHTLCTKCLIDLKSSNKLNACPFDEKLVQKFKKVEEIPKNFALLSLLEGKNLNAGSELEKMRRELREERRQRHELEESHRRIQNNQQMNLEMFKTH